MKKTLLLPLLMFAFGSVFAADKTATNADAAAREELICERIIDLPWQQRHMPKGRECIDTDVRRYFPEIYAAFAELSECATGWRGRTFGYNGCRGKAEKVAAMAQDARGAFRNCMNRNS